jgi:hypothetical protein
MAWVNVEGILRHLLTIGSVGKPGSHWFIEKACVLKQEGIPGTHFKEGVLPLRDEKRKALSSVVDLTLGFDTCRNVCRTFDNPTIWRLLYFPQLELVQTAWVQEVW